MKTRDGKSRAAQDISECENSFPSLSLVKVRHTILFFITTHRTRSSTVFVMFTLDPSRVRDADVIHIRKPYSGFAYKTQVVSY